METYKEYLGDSVYIEVREWDDFRIFTDNGCGEGNSIILEPEVMKNLFNFVNKYKELRYEAEQKD